MKFSNPRTLAEFDDWPSGTALVKCRFEVETHPKRGQRVLRTTTDKSGKWCKPKATTFAPRVIIVDGDDGRTYILCTSSYGFVSVFRSDFMSASPGSIGNGEEGFDEVRKLFEAVPIPAA